MAVKEGDEEWVLVFRQSTALRFGYLDAEGKLHDRWPPGLGEHNPLPEAIVATWETGPSNRAGQVLVGHIGGARRPVYRPYEREVDL
jgi:hypothetical protein